MLIALRIFIDGKLTDEDCREMDEEQLETVPTLIAIRCAPLAATGRVFMAEIEFLDDPNPSQRFLRFGTDPRGMVRPHPIDLLDS